MQAEYPFSSDCFCFPFSGKIASSNIVTLGVFILRYGVELIYKKQPLIRARGVSYCKNLLSPRFEHSEGKAMHFFFMRFHLYYFSLKP